MTMVASVTWLWNRTKFSGMEEFPWSYLFKDRLVLLQRRFGAKWVAACLMQSKQVCHGWSRTEPIRAEPISEFLPRIESQEAYSGPLGASVFCTCQLMLAQVVVQELKALKVGFLSLWQVLKARDFRAVRTTGSLQIVVDSCSQGVGSTSRKIPIGSAASKALCHCWGLVTVLSFCSFKSVNAALCSLSHLNYLFPGLWSRYLMFVESKTGWHSD